ncbi:MAG: SRPBCC family protein [Casimicrobium sp.]
MSIALKILKYLVGLVILFLAVGFLLPATYSAQRSVSISAPVDKVFPLVANQKEWKRWSVWNQRDPNMQLTYAGPEAAAGSKWTWKSKSEGNGGMEWSAVETNKRIGYILTMEDMTPATGDLTFTPEGNGTKVVWSINGNGGMNPIFRWFGLFMDKLIGPDFEAGLKNLKKIAEAA